MNTHAHSREHGHHAAHAHPHPPVHPAKLAVETPTPWPGTSHTCPMHPEVRQEGPGSCPKCGMALEPEGIPAPATKTEYTCPVHPEIVRDEPGNCPICGMALEPRTVILDAEENRELQDMTPSAILVIDAVLLRKAADFPTISLLLVRRLGLARSATEVAAPRAP